MSSSTITTVRETSVISGSVLGSGFLFPSGVAVDGRGNVFVADISNDRIVKIGIGDSPAFTRSHEEGYQLQDEYIVANT